MISGGEIAVIEWTYEGQVIHTLVLDGNLYTMNGIGTGFLSGMKHGVHGNPGWYRVLLIVDMHAADHPAIVEAVTDNALVGDRGSLTDLVKAQKG